MGLFDTILGPGGLGLTNSTQEQTTKPDELTQKLNQLRYDMLTGANQATGGFGNTLTQVGQAGQISPTTQQYLGNAAQYAAQPGLTSDQWYQQALQSMNMAMPLQAQASQNLYSNNQQALGDITGKNINALGQATGGTLDQLGQLNTQNLNTMGQLNTQNLDYINNTLAPQLLGGGNDYFRQILQPQLGNQYSLMGLGRSGASLEAQSKGAASIALPIAQQIAGLTGNQLSQYYGGATGQLGQYYGQAGGELSQFLNSLQSQLGQYFQGSAQNLSQNAAQQAGFGTQYIQNLYGLNQQLPNVDVATRQGQLGRMTEGANLSDYERQQQYGALMAQLQSYITAFNGTPYVPGQTQTGANNQGVLGALAPFATGAGTYLAGTGGAAAAAPAAAAPSASALAAGASLGI